MFSPCIGIISYLPDSKELREERANRCQFFLRQLAEYFPEIPIIVIAQNWSDDVEVTKETSLYRYEGPLKILGARKKLIELFIASPYTHLITFDDDCVLRGGATSAKKYLRLIEENSDRYINQRNMFKLSAFPKRILRQYPLPDISVEDGEGFEDSAYFEILRQNEEGITDISSTGLSERSAWRYDSYSTWDRSKANSLLRKTNSYVKKQRKKQTQ